MSWVRSLSNALGIMPCCCWEETTENLHIVQLSTDSVVPGGSPRFVVADPFDMPVTPSRAVDRAEPGPRPGRQQLREQIPTPRMQWFTMHGVVSDNELGEEERKAALLQIYQDSVLDLLGGLQLTQLAANQEYVDTHCQLMSDFRSLKVDYGSDNSITEFPLANITKMYRIWKQRANQFNLADCHPRTSYSFPETEHIVIIEFICRKLVFVFADEIVAQRFLLCMELLTWQAQHEDWFDGARERIVPLFDEKL